MLRALSGDLAKADQLWTPHRLNQTFEMVVSGIGKANAAGAASRFADPKRHRRLLSVGIAGALPRSGLEVGSTIAATHCTFADEGVQTPSGFLDCDSMGFPLGDFPGAAVPVDAALLNWLRPSAHVLGPIATVSTCSGTDALAHEVQRRTGALAEAMEGGAINLIARRLGIPGGEFRVISNTTGNRQSQQWDLPLALARLSEVIGRLAVIES